MKFNLADNAVTRALSRICDMMCLNVVWIVCCLPIVTIGASTTALYSVMLKMVKNEEGYIFRSFFKAFKENFRQSTILWILFAVLGIIWRIDYSVTGTFPGQAGIYFPGGFYAAGIYTSVTGDLFVSAYRAVCQSDQRNTEERAYTYSGEAALYICDGCGHSGICPGIPVEYNYAYVCDSDVACIRRSACGVDKLLDPQESIFCI